MEKKKCKDEEVIYFFKRVNAAVYVFHVSDIASVIKSDI